jgi:hypothetical protein
MLLNRGNKMKTFSGLVKQYFDFLDSDYGYSKIEEIDRSDPFEIGTIQYKSEKMLVIMEMGPRDFFISLGPVNEPVDARLSPFTINNYLIQNKELPVTTWPREEKAIRVEKRCVRDSAILREKCITLLYGDFSWWLDALDFLLSREKQSYKIRTGKDYPVSTLEKYINAKRDETNNIYKKIIF